MQWSPVDETGVMSTACPKHSINMHSCMAKHALLHLTWRYS